MDWLKQIASWLYAVGIFFRDFFYDNGLLRAREAPVPTICVGNLAVGGTGKTPHTEYIIRLLAENNYQVAVLSRGYMRKTTGFLLADEESTAAQIGDEPLLLKLKYPWLTVAVCEDRLKGLNELHRLFPELNCVILDDAFQHRRLKAGYSMILTQADRLYVDDHLLPYGRLREFASGEMRADMVVITKCPETMQPIDRRIISNKLKLPPFKPLVYSRMAYGEIAPLYPDKKPVIPEGKVLLLTGIAQPHYLLNHIAETGQEMAPLTFGDHHAFTKEDMQLLLTTFQKEGCNYILTTEKDAARLHDCTFFPDNLKQFVFVQPIEVDFLMEDKEIFDNYILRYARQN